MARWQGDLDAARTWIQAALDAYGPLRRDMAHALIVLCPLGLAAEADRAEQARTTGDDAQLVQARSVGLALLQEARAAAGGVGDFGALAQVATLKASLAMAEAEWTRLEGRSDPARG